MNAVAEISRGLRQPSTKPIWFRESILDPRQLSITDITPSSEILKEHAVDLSLDQINQLKNNFTKETDGKYCSSFDVLTAMNLEPHTNVTLVFPINMRSSEEQVLPFRGGYYGNLVSMKTVKATSEYVCRATLAEMVSKLRDAKRRPLKESEEIELSYSTLSVSDWRHTGFFEVDYGWGAPTNIVPYPAKIDLPIGLCALLRSPVFEGGVRLWTQCVWREHLEAFLNEMKAPFDNI
ncbi:acyl transferase 5-like [Asparagus officinalis]|uniref:acyl transferase 5-like n=1 Tax=Asparagus officinalis TaxID=4686 RepID=UPI00098DEA5A|nr:acyl transferase 5-like [Asparagus officinalis]